MNLALDNNTPSRHGSILPLCVVLGQASSSKADGARLTRELQAIRGPTGSKDRRRGARHL